MKKNIFIESVLLRVNGGKPSPDDSVLRSDIEAYLPVVVGYTADKAYNMQVNEERDREGITDFYAQYGPIILDYDTQSGRPNFRLEKAVISLKGNAGLRFVFDDCGNFYTPVPDGAMPNLKYYFNLTPGVNWYRRTGNCIELWTHNELITSVNYQAITDVTALDGEDEIPIQSGLLNEAIEMAARWFLGTKGVPYDAVADMKDDVNSSR